MLKILGYCDRLSVAPGETVRFMVSCTGLPRYRAEIVRIVHGDANPAGPGLKLAKVESPVTGEYASRGQTIDAGSYLRVPDHERLRALLGFTVLAMIWPTTPSKGHQVLLAKWSPDSEAGRGRRAHQEAHPAAPLRHARGPGRRAPAARLRRLPLHDRQHPRDRRRPAAGVRR